MNDDPLSNLLYSVYLYNYIRFHFNHLIPFSLFYYHKYFQESCIVLALDIILYMA